MRPPIALCALALSALAACEPATQPPAAEPAHGVGDGANAPESAAPALPARLPVDLPALPDLPDLAGGHGIDVSHHSGAIDWAAVAKEGYVFAYLKATEGVDDPDPTFGQHWQAAAEHGLHRGAYHFYVTEDDPVEQAHFFLSNVEHRPGDLAPVVDVETLGHGTVGDISTRLHRFLDIVEQEVGVAPIIYTSPKFWNAHLDDSFSRYPLWIAEYDVDEPAIPGGWGAWTIWQFDGDVAVPGVEKGADRSRLHPQADLAALRVPERNTATTSTE
jgi:lysozyme